MERIQPGQVPTVIQGTLSRGFGGLEMVMVDFHRWLKARGIRSLILAVRGSELERRLRHQGEQDSLLIASAQFPLLDSARLRRAWDSPQTAHLFHSQQELKGLLFRKLQGRVVALAHTYYGCRKRDWLHRMAFAQVDQWITLTENQKENLRDCTGVAAEKISVIPNGVDLERYRFHPRVSPGLRGPVRIAVLARLDPQKGQDVAIQALSLLRASGIQAELSFLGEDTPQEAPWSPRLRSLARSEGVEAFVRFHGFEANPPSVLDRFDLVWMPSYKETFGRCVIEAMAFGIPVVASRAGGVPEIIRDRKNGMLFETKNAADLCRQTVALLSDAALYERVQGQARRDVEALYDAELVWQNLLWTAFADASPLLVGNVPEKNSRVFHDLECLKKNFKIPLNSQPETPIGTK